MTGNDILLTGHLQQRIEAVLGHVLTHEQRAAMDVFVRFLADTSPQACMVLRGAAGTGKTTLAAAIVNALLRKRQRLVLLAPTGRAAKVFSLYASHPAFTIHRRIYRQKSAAEPMSSFKLAVNQLSNTLFIVDEASMIANGSEGPDHFGSGSLLDDLISYVYQGNNCRLMLIGDAAQLPPVGESESPALSAEVLRCYGLVVHEACLNEVLRQSQQSGILYNATVVRQMMRPDGGTVWNSDRYENVPCSLPRVLLHGFSDISVVRGDELIEQLASSYSRVGMDDTIVVTRSNKRANIYNQGIRNTILDREEELCRGDRLMIVKNNYYWTEKLQMDNESKAIPFLANGDYCVVQRVRNIRELYGFRFADVTIQMPDYDDFELTCTLLLDTLTTEAPALTREQQELLYQKVLEDYDSDDEPALAKKSTRANMVKEDPYYNALQVKYGYAVTCHKAQGGQWAHVYIDQGYMTDDMLTSSYLHWLYTAFTRATEHLYLVNWPNTQTMITEDSSETTDYTD